MTLLQNYKIVDVDTRESDLTGLIMVKSRQQLISEYPASGFGGKTREQIIVQDCVATLWARYDDRDRLDYYYATRDVQSEYGDASASGNGLIGGPATKAEAILAAWKNGFRTFIQDKDSGLKWELTKNGLVPLPNDFQLYYTAETVAHADTTVDA